MANDKDDEVRSLFTEIGCILEGASLIALIWRDDAGIDVGARYQKLAKAHAKIGILFCKIDKLG